MLKRHVAQRRPRQPREDDRLHMPWIPIYVYEVRKPGRPGGSFEVLRHAPRRGETEVVFQGYSEYQAHAVAQALRDFHLNAERPPQPIQAWYSVSLSGRRPNELSFDTYLTRQRAQGAPSPT